MIDRQKLKEAARESWRSYDCDPVGGNCPSDAFSYISYIQGYIEGASDQLTKAQQELTEAREVIHFYADRENWHYANQDDNLDSLITDDSDKESDWSDWVSGRRARKHLQKWGQG